MERLTATTPYRSANGRARIVTALLTAYIAFSAVNVLLTYAQISTGGAANFNAEELSTLDLLEFGVGLLHLPVIILTIVVFCMWLYRAAQNLPALGNPKHAVQHSPGWAVGSFFVPFVNLVVPYNATKEVWAKSDPHAAAEGYVAPYEPAAPGFMKLWWGFWIVSNIANNVALRLYMRAETPESYVAASWADLVSSLLDIPACVLAITVVREITRRQEERARRVTFVENVPPPPPVFAPPPPPRF